jgi:protein required for attachment to host cells
LTGGETIGEIMVRKPVTWVLVADGAHARIFVNDGVGKGVQEIEERAFVGSRQRDRDIQADKPGRAFDSHGQARHSMEPRTDPHQHQEREFLRGVIEWLSDTQQSQQFDRLVLIAAPHALGDLRALLPKALTAKVIGEVPKNLVRAGAADVESHLADVMPV